MSTDLVDLGKFMVRRQPTVNPALHPNEEFHLFSIPAYDSGVPDLAFGADIGSSKKAVEPGDVLLSRIVPHIRRAWVVPECNGRRQIASSEWLVFRSAILCPRYLRHFLTSDPFHSQFMNTVAGVGGSLLRARPDFVAKIQIPLPPLEEQKRIAAILDKADTIRHKRQEGAALIHSLKRAAFCDMFGDARDNPHQWEMRTLGELCNHELRNGVSPSRSGDFVGYVLILSAITGDRFDPTSVKEGTFAIPFTDSQLVNDNDFLICRGNGNIDLVGKGAFPTQSFEACVFPDTMIAASIDVDLIEKEFLEEVWRSAFVRRQLVTGARTTNGTHKVNQGVLEKVALPVPPKKLQQKYGQISKVCDSAYSKFLDDAADDLFNSLVQRAFRGKL